MELPRRCHAYLKNHCCVARCHCLENSNSLQFALLFSYFNCMAFLQLWDKIPIACCSYLAVFQGSGTYGKRASGSSGNHVLPYLSVFLSMNRNQRPTRYAAQQRCLLRKEPHSVVSSDFLQEQNNRQSGSKNIKLALPSAVNAVRAPFESLQIWKDGYRTLNECSLGKYTWIGKRFYLVVINHLSNS